MFEFILSIEQQQLQSEARAFAKHEIIPIAGECDRRGESPLHLCKKFFDAGWNARFLSDSPEQIAFKLLDFFTVAEELAYGCAGIASTILLPIFLNRIVLHYLSGDAREEFKRRLAQGPCITSFAASEHEAGSDLVTLKTTARRTERGYVINGKKAFSSNVRHADYVIVVARTGPNDSKSIDAFTWFLVPTRTPGVLIGKRWQTLGLASMDLSPIEFNDAEIPASYRLGEESQGLPLMARHLNQSRTGIAAMAVGMARRARDEVWGYSRSHKLYGDRLWKLQDYRFHLVEMEQEIAAARALVWLSCFKYDQGLDHAKEASIAKLYAGKMVMRVTEAASLLLGSMGYVREGIVEKLLRDARHVAIVEGPEPAQKELIFAQMVRKNLY